MKIAKFIYVLGFLCLYNNVEATSLISPYATKMSINYEGDYRLDLEVCGHQLCKLEIKVGRKTYRVKTEDLASVVDPDIRLTELLFDPSNMGSSTFMIKIPLGDYERKYYPMSKFVVLNFTSDGLISMDQEDRRISN